MSLILEKVMAAMVKKSKIVHSKGKFIIFITTIAMLNFLGISYAYWEDSLQMDVSMSTGKMDVSFSNNLYVNTKSGIGYLEASRINDKTITVNGVVYSGYEGDLQYSVTNDGTIPIKFTGDNGSIFNEDIKLTLNQKKEEIKPSKAASSGDNNSKFQINATKPGNHEFEVQLPFSQWNK